MDPQGHPSSSDTSNRALILGHLLMSWTLIKSTRSLSAISNTPFNYSELFKPKAFIPLLEIAIKSWSLPVWQMRGWQSLTVRGKQLTILPWFLSEDATVGTCSEAVWNNAQLLVWYPCVGCAKKRSNMENGGIKGSKFKQSVTQKREKRCEQSCNQ